MDYYSKYKKYKNKYQDLKILMNGGQINTSRVLIGIYPNDQKPFLLRAQKFQNIYNKDNFHITLLDIFVNKNHPNYNQVIAILKKIIHNFDFNFTAKEYEMLGTFFVINYQIDNTDKYNSFRSNILKNFMAVLNPRNIEKIGDIIYFKFNDQPLLGFPSYFMNDNGTFTPFHSHISIYKFLEQKLKDSKQTSNNVIVPINRNINGEYKIATLSDRTFNLPLKTDDPLRLNCLLEYYINEKIIPKFKALPEIPKIINNSNSKIQMSII